jgi:hypothetical protein
LSEIKAVTSYSDREPIRDDRADLRDAYQRGRDDARAARRRHPFLMTLTVLVAAVGLVVLALAAVNGSFGGAGQVMDRSLATAADKAEPAARNAADKAGQAVRDVTAQDRTNPAATPR